MIQMAEFFRQLHPYLAIFCFSYIQKIHEIHHCHKKEQDDQNSIQDLSKAAEKILINL